MVPSVEQMSSCILWIYIFPLPLPCIHSLLVAQLCVRAVGALLAPSPPEISVDPPVVLPDTALMWRLLKVGKMNLLKWPGLSQVGLEWGKGPMQHPLSSFGVPSSTWVGFLSSVGSHTDGC